MYMIKYLIAITVIIAYAQAENVGWQKYFTENPTEFHDLPLKWENGNQTNVPSWLSGVYVRNGPAQVLFFFNLSFLLPFYSWHQNVEFSFFVFFSFLLPKKNKKSIYFIFCQILAIVDDYSITPAIKKIFLKILLAINSSIF